MSIKDDLELANTRVKLERLEARYEARQSQPTDDPVLRRATLRSLKSTINQFKEEIVRYLAHRSAANTVSESEHGRESPVNPSARAGAASRASRS